MLAAERLGVGHGLEDGLGVLLLLELVLMIVLCCLDCLEVGVSSQEVVFLPQVGLCNGSRSQILL